MTNFYDAIKNENIQQALALEAQNEGPHIDRTFLKKGEIVFEDFSPEFQMQLIYNGVITSNNLSEQLKQIIAFRNTITYDDLSLETQKLMARNKFINLKDLSYEFQDQLVRKNIGFQELSPELRQMFDYMVDRTIKVIDCGFFNEDAVEAVFDGGEW